MYPSNIVFIFSFGFQPTYFMMILQKILIIIVMMIIPTSHPFIMHSHRRKQKGKYGRDCFSCVFKCTYKLLLCPVALLFIHHFIIKGVDHLLSCVENVILKWFMMTCDKGNWQEANTDKTCQTQMIYVNDEPLSPFCL